MQVRDAKTGGRLSPQTLESLCDSLWQVAIGAVHPKRLSGGSAATAAASSTPGAARRANSGGSYAALSLTTVAEALRMRFRLSSTRGLTQALPLQADSAATPAPQRRSFDGTVEEEDAVVRNCLANADHVATLISSPFIHAYQ